MRNYLEISYWFALYPPAWNKSGEIFIWVTLIVLVISFLLKLFLIFKNNKNKGINRKALNKLSNCFIVSSLLALVYWFMRQQLIPFFSSRFWLLIIFITTIVWISFIIWYFIRKKREEKINLEQIALYGKYLPGKK